MAGLATHRAVWMPDTPLSALEAELASMGGSMRSRNTNVTTVSVVTNVRQSDSGLLASYLGPSADAISFRSTSGIPGSHACKQVVACVTIPSDTAAAAGLSDNCNATSSIHQYQVDDGFLVASDVDEQRQFTNHPVPSAVGEGSFAPENLAVRVASATAAERITKTACNAWLEGFDTSVICAGQTGSGKSSFCLGSPVMPGVHRFNGSTDSLLWAALLPAFHEVRASRRRGIAQRGSSAADDSNLYMSMWAIGSDDGFTDLLGGSIEHADVASVTSGRSVSTGRAGSTRATSSSLRKSEPQPVAVRIESEADARTVLNIGLQRSGTFLPGVHSAESGISGNGRPPILLPVPSPSHIFVRLHLIAPLSKLSATLPSSAAKRHDHGAASLASIGRSLTIVDLIGSPTVQGPGTLTLRVPTPPHSADNERPNSNNLIAEQLLSLSRLVDIVVSAQQAAGIADLGSEAHHQRLQATARMSSAQGQIRAQSDLAARTHTGGSNTARQHLSMPLFRHDSRSNAPDGPGLHVTNADQGAVRAWFSGDVSNAVPSGQTSGRGGIASHMRDTNLAVHLAPLLSGTVVTTCVGFLSSAPADALDSIRTLELLQAVGKIQVRAVRCDVPQAPRPADAIACALQLGSQPRHGSAATGLVFTIAEWWKRHGQLLAHTLKDHHRNAFAGERDNVHSPLPSPAASIARVSASAAAHRASTSPAAARSSSPSTSSIRRSPRATAGTRIVGSPSSTGGGLSVRFSPTASVRSQMTGTAARSPLVHMRSPTRAASADGGVAPVAVDGLASTDINGQTAFSTAFEAEVKALTAKLQKQLHIRASTAAAAAASLPVLPMQHFADSLVAPPPVPRLNRSTEERQQPTSSPTAHAETAAPAQPPFPLPAQPAELAVTAVGAVVDASARGLQKLALQVRSLNEPTPVFRMSAAAMPRQSGASPVAAGEAVRSSGSGDKNASVVHRDAPPVAEHHAQVAAASPNVGGVGDGSSVVVDGGTGGAGSAGASGASAALDAAASPKPSTSSSNSSSDAQPGLDKSAQSVAGGTGGRLAIAPGVAGILRDMFGSYQQAHSHQGSPLQPAPDNAAAQHSVSSHHEKTSISSIPSVASYEGAGASQPDGDAGNDDASASASGHNSLRSDLHVEQQQQQVDDPRQRKHAQRLQQIIASASRPVSRASVSPHRIASPAVSQAAARAIQSSSSEIDSSPEQQSRGRSMSGIAERSETSPGGVDADVRLRGAMLPLRPSADLPPYPHGRASHHSKSPAGRRSPRHRRPSRSPRNKAPAENGTSAHVQHHRQSRSRSRDVSPAAAVPDLRSAPSPATASPSRDSKPNPAMEPSRTPSPDRLRRGSSVRAISPANRASVTAGRGTGSHSPAQSAVIAAQARSSPSGAASSAAIDAHRSTSPGQPPRSRRASLTGAPSSTHDGRDANERSDSNVDASALLRLAHSAVEGTENTRKQQHGFHASNMRGQDESGSALLRMASSLVASDPAGSNDTSSASTRALEATHVAMRLMPESSVLVNSGLLHSHVSYSSKSAGQAGSEEDEGGGNHDIGYHHGQNGPARGRRLSLTGQPATEASSNVMEDAVYSLAAGGAFMRDLLNKFHDQASETETEGIQTGRPGADYSRTGAGSRRDSTSSDDDIIASRPQHGSKRLQQPPADVMVHRYFASASSLQLPVLPASAAPSRVPSRRSSRASNVSSVADSSDLAEDAPFPPAPPSLGSHTIIRKSSVVEPPGDYAQDLTAREGVSVTISSRRNSMTTSQIIQAAAVAAAEAPASRRGSQSLVQAPVAMTFAPTRSSPVPLPWLDREAALAASESAGLNAIEPAAAAPPRTVRHSPQRPSAELQPGHARIPMDDVNNVNASMMTDVSSDSGMSGAGTTHPTYHHTADATSGVRGKQPVEETYDVDAYARADILSRDNHRLQQQRQSSSAEAAATDAADASASDIDDALTSFVSEPELHSPGMASPFRVDKPSPAALLTGNSAEVLKQNRTQRRQSGADAMQRPAEQEWTTAAGPSAPTASRPSSRASLTSTATNHRQQHHHQQHQQHRSSPLERIRLQAEVADVEAALLSEYQLALAEGQEALQEVKSRSAQGSRPASRSDNVILNPAAANEQVEALTQRLQSLVSELQVAIGDKQHAHDAARMAQAQLRRASMGSEAAAGAVAQPCSTTQPQINGRGASQPSHIASRGGAASAPAAAPKDSIFDGSGSRFTRRDSGASSATTGGSVSTAATSAAAAAAAAAVGNARSAYSYGGSESRSQQPQQRPVQASPRTAARQSAALLAARRLAASMLSDSTGYSGIEDSRYQQSELNSTNNTSYDAGIGGSPARSRVVHGRASSTELPSTSALFQLPSSPSIGRRPSAFTSPPRARTRGYGQPTNDDNADVRRGGLSRSVGAVNESGTGKAGRDADRASSITTASSDTSSRAESLKAAASRAREYAASLRSKSNVGDSSSDVAAGGRYQGGLRQESATIDAALQHAPGGVTARIRDAELEELLQPPIQARQRGLNGANSLAKPRKR